MALFEVDLLVGLAKDKTVYFQGCDGNSKLHVKLLKGSLGVITQRTAITSEIELDEYMVQFELTPFTVSAQCTTYELKENGPNDR